MAVVLHLSNVVQCCAVQEAQQPAATPDALAARDTGGCWSEGEEPQGESGDEAMHCMHIFALPALQERCDILHSCSLVLVANLVHWLPGSHSWTSSCT